MSEGTTNQLSQSGHEVLPLHAFLHLGKEKRPSVELGLTRLKYCPNPSLLRGVGSLGSLSVNPPLPHVVRVADLQTSSSFDFRPRHPLFTKGSDLWGKSIEARRLAQIDLELLLTPSVTKIHCRDDPVRQHAAQRLFQHLDTCNSESQPDKPTRFPRCHDGLCGHMTEQPAEQK